MNENLIVLQRASTGARIDTFEFNESPTKYSSSHGKTDTRFQKSSIDYKALTLNTVQSPKRHSCGVFTHYIPRQNSYPTQNPLLNS